jgi:hypothetical protein
MRAAEFLRGLADMLSAMEDDKPAQAPVIVNVNAGAPTAAQGDAQVDDNTGKFIPPLQQKIELMKKTAGVNNAFDASAEEDEPFDG